MGSIRINVIVVACRHPQSASCLNLSNYVSAVEDAKRYSVVW